MAISVLILHSHQQWRVPFSPFQFCLKSGIPKAFLFFGNSLDVHLAGYSETLQQVKEKENGYQVGLSRGKNANNTTASNKVIPYSAWRSV